MNTKVLKWLLLASLGLNLVVLGAWAGYRWLPSTGDDSKAHSSLAWFLENIPKESHSKIKPIIDHYDPIAMADHDKVYTIRQQMLDQLAADKLDPSAFEQSIEQLSQAKQEMLQTINHCFSDVVEKLDVQERQHLASALGKCCNKCASTKKCRRSNSN